MGDIESLPFLEAIRQMGIEQGRDNACYIHLTLVPYLPTVGEIKTKPTQHSVKELREIGIQPDVVMCRSERAIPDEERRKIALFTNVDQGAVISCYDARFDLQDSEDVAQAGPGRNRLPQTASDAEAGRSGPCGTTSSTRWKIPEHEIDLAMVGKYVDLTDSYKSLSEALIHAGIHTRTKVKIHYLDSEQIEKDGVAVLANMDAILVPGGFGKRGTEGKIAAVKFARENKIPYLGHLPRHADRHHRVRPQRGGSGQRQLDRVRSGNAAPGGRADHRMAEQRRQGREARLQFQSGWHHAPGRAALHRAAGNAGASDLPVGYGQRASSSSLRSQQSLRPRASKPPAL